jgi:hypothetical protein
MNTPVKILDLEDLIERSSHFNPAECVIQLNGGFSSRKLISYFPDTKEWWVYHLIDETENTYATTTEMFERTNIGKALEKGALWLERVEVEEY